MRFALFLALFASSAVADERAVFYGTWGTNAQCSGQPLVAGGTVNAAPFEIDDAFLKHGDIWCRLTWGPTEERSGVLTTGALALCGEDSVQGYQIGLDLADEALSLRWGLFVKNGPLARCTAP